MNQEIYVLSKSDILTHNFCVYATKSIMESEKLAVWKNVKFFDIVDLARSEIDGFCKQRIGISAFNKNPSHKKIVDKLLNVYAYEIMEEIDEDWWINKLIETSSELSKSVPVTIFNTFNQERHLDKLLSQGKNIILLSEESDSEAYGISRILKLSQDFKLNKEEDVLEKELVKVKKFITELLEDLCMTKT